VSDTSSWVLAAPFLASAVLVVVSPIPVATVRKSTRDYYSQQAAPSQVYALPSALADRAEWAIDASQAWVVTLVPVMGLIFAIPGDVPGLVALGYLVALVVGFLLFLWVVNTDDASAWARRRFLRVYSVVAGVGFLVNAVGAALVLALK
jgi:hypothetical protein